MQPNRSGKENSRQAVTRFEEISRLADRPLEPSEETDLRSLFRHVSHRINQITRSIRRAGPGLPD
jgi:hypothetical protein